MMVKFRDIVNPVILNHEKWIGFFGDSEYCDKNKELKMGYWSLQYIIDDNEVNGIPYKLDDSIDENMLYDIPIDECVFAIENDNGTVCAVKFYYDE